MIAQSNLLALSILSFVTFANARPENLRGRTYPDSNTCPCLPSSEPSTITSTTTATATETKTIEATAPVIKETTTASQTLTLTVTRPPLTETVYISQSHPGETITVTCTKTVSEKPDGSVTTKSQNPLDGERTKTVATESSSETQPPPHDGETTKTPMSATTESASATTSDETKPTEPSISSSNDAATTTTDKNPETTVQSVKPTVPAENSSAKPSLSSLDDDSTSAPESATSKHHCDHWDGTRCVKPTMTSASFVTATTTRDAQSTDSICSVSVAFVTVYNTITATIYQGGAATASSTAPGNVPRAPTSVVAY